MHKHIVYDGRKNININALPEEAWRSISGDDNKNTLLPVVFRCIKMRANAVSSMPFIIKDDNGEIVYSSNDNISNDNKLFKDLTQVFYATESSLSIYGKSFFFKVRNGLDDVIGLQLFQSNSIKPVWDKDEGLTHFVRTVGQQKKTFDVDDIIYTAFQSVSSETGVEQSPLDVANLPIDVINNLESFVSDYLDRGAIKATLIQVPDSSTDLERQMLKSWWARVINGVKSAWTGHVISSDIKFNTIGEGLEVLKDEDITRSRKEDIAIAFGVPFSKLFSNASNHATAIQDDLNFYKDTVIPECVLIQSSFNKQLFDNIGYTLQFQPETLSIFQVDEAERSQAFSNLANAGLRPSVVAQILGYSLPDGLDYSDLDITLFDDPNQAPVAIIEPIEGNTPKDDIKSNLPPSMPVEGESKESLVVDEEEKFVTWAKNRLKRGKDIDITKFNSDILENSTKHTIYKNLLLDGYDRERNKLEDKLSNDIEKSFSTLVEEIVDNPDLAEDKIIHDTSLNNIIVEHLETTIDLGIEFATKVLNLELATKEANLFAADFELINENVLDWLNNYSFELITGINDTSRQRVRLAIQEWVTSGEPLTVLVRSLVDSVFTPQRARAIAETEVTRAFAEANREVYLRSGVVERIEWSTARDDLVCPICRPLDGNTVSIHSALGFSGEHRNPPAHVRCRCWILPVIENNQVANDN